MEHKKHIVSLVKLVCMLCAVDFVTSSRVTTLQDMSSLKRLSFQEEYHVGGVDVCADIIGPEWKITKQEKVDYLCPELLVWVPKTGFTELVKVNQKSQLEGGFSIAIFCYVLHVLPFNIQPIFKPFVNAKGESNGTYDDLLKQIRNQPSESCQAVVGDVTVRASRTPFYDFTIPYQGAELYMLVRATHEWNQTLWTFLKPFTWRLWIVIVGAGIYIGFAVAFLEYRVGNPKFKVPVHQKVVMIIWFPISTFFFYEGKILNKNSKVVLITWLSMIFIIVQIFTATLSSWLTIDQLRPKLPSSFENVGYQYGGYVDNYITQNYNCSGKHLMALKSIEEYKNALSNGSISAIFDELPYIDLFLAKYSSDYMKVGPLNQQSGHAFAFPHDSPLVNYFTRAVVNVTESEIMMKMKEKYFRFDVPNGSQSNQALPQSLDIHSFIGLFIFTGILTIVAIILSESSIMSTSTKNKILPIST
ncbi:putative solute-binding protein family 3/ domain of MltF [Helianthus debilis subsp. tardiflorus]